MPGAPTLLGDAARRLPGLTRRMSAAHAGLALRTRAFDAWFGARILVLETRGRRSGRLRATPLVYLRDGDDLAVVPANAGADRPPAWWLNLQAAGEGFVVLGGRRRRVTPTIAAAAAHERLWRRMASLAPIDHYQRRSRRPLPVVLLSPAHVSRAIGEPVTPKLVLPSPA